jgi:hypothetical protein
MRKYQKWTLYEELFLLAQPPKRAEDMVCDDFQRCAVTDSKLKKRSHNSIATRRRALLKMGWEYRTYRDHFAGKSDNYETPHPLPIKSKVYGDSFLDIVKISTSPTVRKILRFKGLRGLVVIDCGD